MEQLLKGRNREYLMGVAIILIIAFHFCFYSNLLSNKIIGFFMSHGYIGVDIFLFLSAYGLCFSYERNGAKRYYLHRIKRLYPMYLFFVAVTAFLFHEFYDDSAIKLAIFQCTGIASFRMVDFEWFIPALIVIYLIFPLLFCGVKWLYKREKWILPGILIIIALLVHVLSKVVFPLFALRIPIVFLGIITYFAIKNDDNRFLIACYLICALFSLLTKSDDGLKYSLLVPMILWCLGEIDIKWPFEKSISFMGRHSLEIYLAQSLALNHYFLVSDTPFIQKCLIALSIIILSSFVFFFCQNFFYSLFAKRH